MPIKLSPHPAQRAPIAQAAQQDNSAAARLGRWLQGLRRGLLECIAQVRLPSWFTCGGLRSHKVSVVPAPTAQVPSALGRQKAWGPASGQGIRNMDDSTARRQRSAQAVSAFERALNQACPATSGAADLGGRLERLADLEARLQAMEDLDEDDRSRCSELLATRRRAVEPDRAILEKMLAAVTENLRSDGLQEALPGRRAQLADLQKALPLCRAFDAAAREALEGVLRTTQSRLRLLETRDTDLAAISRDAARMGTALGKLSPQAYLDARSSLSLLQSRLAATPAHLLMERLDEMIQHPDQARWLKDMADGDPMVIDTVFKGAQWHDDALTLKLATIQPDDAKALRNLDVQHNLRMVADDLDAFMASRNALDGKGHLPVSLFGAVKANPSVIAWLVNYASKEVGTRSAQIGAWISLSLYDPARGAVDEAQADELLAQLKTQGIDADALRQHIPMGLQNPAEIVKCRELMESVARACQEATLLTSLDEARFPGLRASRIVCELFREVTGMDTEIATGQEVDDALAKAVDKAMPWVQFEHDLVHAQGNLDWILTQLKQGQDGRQWLAKPDQLAAAVEDHDRVRDILFADATLEALKVKMVALADYKKRPDQKVLADSIRGEAGQDSVETLERRAQAGDPDAIKRLEAHYSAETQKQADVISEKLNELHGFNPAQLRRDPGYPFTPTLSGLRAIRVDMELLVRLPALHNTKAMLAQLAKPSAEQSKSAALLIDRLRRIAILQTGLESGDPEFRPNGIRPDQGGGYTGQIIKRLAAFGLSAHRPSPFLKNVVQSVAQTLGKDERSLHKLVDEFDPQTSVAKMQRAFRGVSLGKRGSLSAPAATTEKARPPLSVTEGQRKQALALASVQRQVQQLGPGQAFDIRLGAYGTVSVGSPIVPGLSVSTDVRAEVQNSIRVALQDDGSYRVRVQSGGAVRHGITLSTLAEAISFRGESQAEREKGFDLRFGDRDSCIAMLRGLITGGEIDPSLWAVQQVQRVDRQSLEGRASVSAKADLTLASLSAELAAAIGFESTVVTSTNGEVQTQVRRFSATTTASAGSPANNASREVSTGLALAASKTIERRYGMICPGSQATFSAIVVGGNADQCLQALLPEDAGLSKEQRQAFIDSLPRDYGRIPDGTELFVRYALTPVAIREANSLLGQASAALTRASVSSGEMRQVAVDQAKDWVRQAHQVTQRAESYTLEGVGWTRREQKEVTRNRGVYQQFARGGLETRGFTAVDRAAAPAAAPPGPALVRLLP